MSEGNGPVRDTDVGRCARCGARVVPGQDWCSLCLQPLAAAPAGPAEGEVLDGTDDLLDGGPRGVGPVTGPPPGAAPADPTHPADPADPYASSRAAAAPGPGDDLPPLTAEAMLAELAATSAADRPLGRGPLAGTSRGVRVALGCGAAVVLVGLLMLLLTLLGLLL